MEELVPNEVDEEIKGVDARDKVKLKHNERSNQLSVERMMSVAEHRRASATTDDERVLRGR